MNRLAAPALVSIAMLSGCLTYIEPKESYLVGDWVSVDGSRAVTYIELHYREQGPSYLVVTGVHEASIVTLNEFTVRYDDMFHLRATCPSAPSGIDCLHVEGGRLGGAFLKRDLLNLELELEAETATEFSLVPADSLPKLRQHADELARRYRESMAGERR